MIAQTFICKKCGKKIVIGCVLTPWEYAFIMTPRFLRRCPKCGGKVTGPF